MISTCSAFQRAKPVNLVVDVGDVHNEMNIVTKVVFEDATENILSNIVAKKVRDVSPIEHSESSSPYRA